MAVSDLLGVLSIVVLVAFVVFAFRQGRRVKPDGNRKTEDWPRGTQGGSD